MGAPPRRRPRHLESREQRLFVRQFRLDPRTRNLPACAVPNGGLRSPREAAIMKAEGIEPGVPDWLLFAPRRFKPAAVSMLGPWGLALEFKSPTGKGRVTEHQKRWHSLLREAGWRVEIVTNASDAWRIVLDHLGYETFRQHG